MLEKHHPRAEQILKQSLGYHGYTNQLDMMTEECGELVVAINHLKRGRVESSKLLEELIDVMIVAEQLLLGFEPNEIGQMVQTKLNRLEERMEKSHE